MKIWESPKAGTNAWERLFLIGLLTVIVSYAIGVSIAVEANPEVYDRGLTRSFVSNVGPLAIHVRGVADCRVFTSTEVRVVPPVGWQFLSEQRVGVDAEILVVTYRTPSGAESYEITHAHFIRDARAQGARVDFLLFPSRIQWENQPEAVHP